MSNFVHNYSFFQKKRQLFSLVVFLFLFILWWFCLPTPLFQDPTSMVLLDRNKDLLGAKIAEDGQWRFPPVDSVPDKFIQAIIEFEDRRFYSHWGIDPRGIGRAIQQNFKSKKIVSGGSTLTMQTARMARKGKSRSFLQKSIEILWALRMEIKYSKAEIMSLYASNAPFGGNVVGLDAASWRYYAKSPHLLSWAEAATLAVLPNSPSLIHPGRNRAALLSKRNRLIDRLLEKGVLDKWTGELAKEEPLPDKPIALPRLAPHLLERAFLEEIAPKKGTKTLVRSSIKKEWQSRVNSIVKPHQEQLKANEIYNLSVVILDVETGEILAYIGNAPDCGREHHEDVDIAKAARSTGSILKPFLYELAVQEGTILPSSLLSDIPSNMSGYRPENFHQKYDGVVPADRALIRSLNVPMVRLLQKYGLEKFHHELKKLNLTTINRSPKNYGLTLILGGAEGNLLEITNAYACMARTLNHFLPQYGEYQKNEFRPATYLLSSPQKAKEKALLKEAPRMTAAGIWQTFEAMKQLERPNAEGEWQRFDSGKSIAWKTGTSFGFRDAWAVGVTPRYAVGVWAGNADGEGRPGCVGIRAAAPILFDIFEILPNSAWFEQPFDEMTEIAVCKKSGNRALANCEIDRVFVPNGSLNAPACSFHRAIHLDKNREYQVTSECLNPADMVHEFRFVLPPVEEYYYKGKHPDYEILPPYRKDCLKGSNDEIMELIYPKQNTRIYIPKDLDGTRSRTIFKAAHRIPSKEVYWHLDNVFMGSTQNFHSMEMLPEVGEHRLTLVDEDGNREEMEFEVLE